MTHINGSRRRFIKQGGSLSAAGWVGAPLLLNLSAMADASAITGGTYQALVCVYLGGGNDSFGTVFPSDDVTWQTYQKKRNDLLAARDAYLQINKSPTDTTKFSLHPKLNKVADLYNARTLSIVGNVGTLRAPTDRNSYAGTSVAKPPKLFSHNDQTSIWQTGMPEGAAQGWGGAALVKAGATSTSPTAANNMFAAVGVGTTPPFLAASTATFGSSIKPYGIGPDGALPMTQGYAQGNLFNHFTNLNKLTSAWRGDYKTLTHEMERDVTAVAKRSQDAWQILRNESLAPITPFDDFRKPQSGLQAQLRVVADMIKASGSANMAIQKQVFFVQLGGFDTHADQLSRQNALLTELGDALAYFDTLLGDDRSKVTTFTASDFGRKLQANADGTDHGWGGHHFVMGGVVSGNKGGKVLGHFPSLALDANGAYTDLQMLDDGTLIPKIPLTSYLQPIAEWFGVSDFNTMWKALDKDIVLPQSGFPVLSFA